MTHDIDVLIEDARWRRAGLAALAGRAIAATLADRAVPAAAVSVLGCDDARIAALNADFRGKPFPADVLSWPEEDLSAGPDGAPPRPPRPGPGGARALGDIAIAYDTCAREAAGRGKPMRAHAAHLLVHGTLHLLGYDHARDRDAALMEGVEVEVLGKLGLPDPY